MSPQPFNPLAGFVNLFDGGHHCGHRIIVGIIVGIIAAIQASGSISSG
jgi:hypothetical protein